MKRHLAGSDFPNKARGRRKESYCKSASQRDPEWNFEHIKKQRNNNESSSLPNQADKKSRSDTDEDRR